MRIPFVLSTILILVAADEEISECLKKCILPLAKQERSFSHIFKNYDHVCDLLEDGAYCARKCETEDQRKFHQYSTFYRIICIDYQEDLEPHLPCLSEAAKEIDAVCHDKCHGNKYAKEKIDGETDKQVENCKAIECSTICFYQEFVEDCPDAKDALLKLNIGQIHTIANSIHPLAFEKMGDECKRIHNTDYMKKKLNDFQE
ncbi:unnamed protein product [Auanema sp. JU1783]|nr:unnamed protein product [Auanema sp. JU1783]